MWLHELLTLALDKIDWSDSRSDRFSLGTEPPERAE